MSNIYLPALFEQKTLEFKTQGQGSTRFASDFLNAVNRAIRRINRDADLATRVSTVTQAEGTIGIDDAYEDIVSDLVTVNLVAMGQTMKAEKSNEYARMVRALPMAIDGMRRDIMNQAQDADTDDETDRIGLGALG